MGGLKRCKPRRAPKPDAESESNDESDAVKDLEVKAMVKRLYNFVPKSKGWSNKHGICSSSMINARRKFRTSWKKPKI